MSTVHRIARLLPLPLLLGLAAPLHAAKPGSSTTTYIREWLNVCGGTKFITCASVRLIVSGVNVEMRAWNLSGGSAGGYAGAVIRNISLLNVPATVYTASSMTTSGPYWTGASTPYPFSITDTNSDGAGVVQLTKFMVSNPITRADSLNSGFASSCAATTSGMIPTGTRLWMTQSNGCSTTQISSTSGTDYLTFNFSTNVTFDPNAADVQLGITSIDMTSPMVTSYYEAIVTPEPATLLLLGSGLLGMGGAGLTRRRRREREPGGEVPLAST